MDFNGIFSLFFFSDNLHWFRCHAIVCQPRPAVLFLDVICMFALVSHSHFLCLSNKLCILPVFCASWIFSLLELYRFGVLFLFLSRSLLLSLVFVRVCVCVCAQRLCHCIHSIQCPNWDIATIVKMSERKKEHAKDTKRKDFSSHSREYNKWNYSW